jgi:hypothetical protein
VDILVVNISDAIITDLIKTLSNIFQGKKISKIKIIYNTDIRFEDVGKFNYFIIDPVSHYTIDRKMIDILLLKKKVDAQIIVLTTVYCNIFGAMGIKKIIKMPVSWEKFSEILLA